jgi:hypothetical protein
VHHQHRFRLLLRITQSEPIIAIYLSQFEYPLATMLADFDEVLSQVFDGGRVRLHFLEHA